MAAARLLNENTNLFGHAQLQIDLNLKTAVDGQSSAVGIVGHSSFGDAHH
jgi:hypothetical protein